MTLAELKDRIAKKYETEPDNLIVCIGDRCMGETSEDEALMLTQDLGIDEYQMVKVDFKVIPSSLQSKYAKMGGLSSSVVVTTLNADYPL